MSKKPKTMTEWAVMRENRLFPIHRLVDFEFKLKRIETKLDTILAIIAPVPNNATR